MKLLEMPPEVLLKMTSFLPFEDYYRFRGAGRYLYNMLPEEISLGLNDFQRAINLIHSDDSLRYSKMWEACQGIMKNLRGVYNFRELENPSPEWVRRLNSKKLVVHLKPGGDEILKTDYLLSEYLFRELIRFIEKSRIELPISVCDGLIKYICTLGDVLEYFSSLQWDYGNQYNLCHKEVDDFLHFLLRRHERDLSKHEDIFDIAIRNSYFDLALLFLNDPNFHTSEADTAFHSIAKIEYYRGVDDPIGVFQKKIFDRIFQDSRFTPSRSVVSIACNLYDLELFKRLCHDGRVTVTQEDFECVLVSLSEIYEHFDENDDAEFILARYTPTAKFIQENNLQEFLEGMPPDSADQ